MEVRFVPLDLARLDGLRMEVLALPFFEDERPLKGVAGLCDWRLCGALSKLLIGGRVVGSTDEVTLVPGRPRLPFEKLILYGEGRAEDFDAAAAERVTARVLSTLPGAAPAVARAVAAGGAERARRGGRGDAVVSPGDRAERRARRGGDRGRRGGAAGDGARARSRAASGAAVRAAEGT